MILLMSMLVAVPVFAEDQDVCEHDWQEWEVTKKATVFKGGTKSRECWNCGEVQTKATSKIEPFAKFKKKTYSVAKGKTLKLEDKGSDPVRDS